MIKINDKDLITQIQCVQSLDRYCYRHDGEDDDTNKVKVSEVIFDIGVTPNIPKSQSPAVPP